MKCLFIFLKKKMNVELFIKTKDELSTRIILLHSESLTVFKEFRALCANAMKYKIHCLFPGLIEFEVVNFQRHEVEKIEAVYAAHHQKIEQMITDFENLHKSLTAEILESEDFTEICQLFYDFGDMVEEKKRELARIDELQKEFDERSETISLSLRAFLLENEAQG